MRGKIALIVLLVSVLLVSLIGACQGAAPSPTAAPKPSLAPAPSPAASPAPAPKPSPAPSAAPTAKPAAKEVTVLNLSDLTGRNSSINIPATAMIEAFFKYVNEVEGGITGKQGTVTVKVMVADTQYDVKKAKESWARARDAGAITGFHLMSGLAEGLIDDVEKDKIPLVSGSWGLKAPWSEWQYASGHPGLPDCTATEGVLGAQKIAESLGKPKPTIIGTMSTDAPFEPMFFIGIDAWMKENGVTIKRETFPAGSPDLTVNLLRLKNAGVQAVYGICTVADMATMNKDIARMGWKDVIVNHSNCTGAADLVRIGGWEYLEGRYFTNFYVPIDADPKYQGPGHTLARDLFKKYRPNEPVTDNGIYGLIGALVMKGAIKTALDNVTPDKLTGATLKSEGLDKLTNLDMMGLTSNISYKPGNDHPGPNNARVWKVEGKKLVAVGDWFQYTKIKPKV